MYTPFKWLGMACKMLLPMTILVAEAPFFHYLTAFTVAQYERIQLLN